MCNKLPSLMQREAFINELADAYIQKFPTDKDGKIHV